MSLDLRNRLTKEMQEVRKAGEAAYIIKNYGFTAWYQLAGLSRLTEARDLLEEMMNDSVVAEAYEDAALFRDAIKPIKKSND